MNKDYKLSHRLIARMLLVSLFLQSCGNLSNQLTPREKEPAHKTPESRKKNDIHWLVGQEFIAEGGHVVTFHELEGDLRADVAMMAPAGFSKTYKDIDVHIANDINVEELANLSLTTQKKRMHFIPPKSVQLGKLCIYEGLKGGMMEGDVDEEVAIPDECFCPITQEIMEDPVVAQDGHTYERSAIAHWLKLGKRISPKTGARLLSTELTPNYSMRSLIQDLKSQLPVLARHKVDMKNIEAAIQLREEEMEERLTQKNYLMRQGEKERLILAERLRQKEEELVEKTALLQIEQIEKESPKKVERIREKETENTSGGLDKRIEEIIVNMLVDGEAIEKIMRWTSVSRKHIEDLQKMLQETVKKEDVVVQLRSQTEKSSKLDEPKNNKKAAAFNKNSAKNSRNNQREKEPIRQLELELELEMDIKNWPQGEEILTQLNSTGDTLNLPYYQITNKQIGILVWHPRFHQIHILDLSSNRIGTAGAIKLAKVLPNTQIHTLDLSDNEIGDAGVSMLVEVLPNTQIHTLDLSNNEISDFEAFMLAEILSSTQIHTLDLSYNEIGKAGAIELAKVLPNTQIHTLDLSWNQIGDAGAIKLVAALPNTQIHTLDLSYNEIGKAGATKLAEVLPNTQIHTLDLRSNQIGDAGAIKLAAALPNTQIHTLKLSYNEIGAQTKIFLRQKCPNINFEF